MQRHTEEAGLEERPQVLLVIRTQCRVECRRIECGEADLVRFILIEAAEVRFALIGTAVAFGSIGIRSRIVRIQRTDPIRANIINERVPVAVLIPFPTQLRIGIHAARTENVAAGGVVATLIDQTVAIVVDAIDRNTRTFEEFPADITGGDFTELAP